MMKPTVHLGGTSGEELFRQITEARDALEAALDALRSASPNGRDYYLQPQGAFERAASEYGARMDALRKVSAELEEIQLDIYKQNEVSAARRRA